jgi:hypothetical protein
MSWRAVWVGMCVGLVACNSLTPECTAKVAEMRAVFAQGPADRVAIEVPEGVTLAEARGGERVEEGMTVAVLADGGLRFRGEAFATVPPYHAALSQALREYQAPGSDVPPPTQLGVIADGGAPASVIAAIAEGLPVGLELVLIVHLAGDTSPTPPPMSPAVAAGLASPNRHEAVLDLLIPPLSSCKLLKQAWNDAMMGDHELRGETLFAVIPETLEKCRCEEQTDVATLTAVIWAEYGRTGRTRRQLPVALVGDPAAEAVALAANATVRELVAIVEGRAGRPLRVVRGA